MMALQVHQDRPELEATQKRKIVYPQEEDRFSRAIRQSHNTTQDRLARRAYPQTSGQSSPSFAASRQPNGGDLLAMSDCHPRPRFNKGWKALGKHFTLAEWVATVELANREHKLNTATSARNITHASAVMILDGRGRFRTERTARRRMRCAHRNHQASFRDLDLINEHALGKWKQWCSFHGILALRDETILKRFLMKGTIPLQVHLPLQATEQFAPNPAMSHYSGGILTIILVIRYTYPHSAG